MNHILPAVRTYLFMTILLGLLYPVIITVIGQNTFPRQANGSLIERNGKVIGSQLIAQKFENDRYFWPRPSATDYNPLPSGGSNLGPTSAALKEAFSSRQSKLGLDAPKALLFASGSGLDPEIDVASAMFQIPRIARTRGMPEEELRSIISVNIEKRQFRFLGEERLNVLKLNLALDERR